MIHTTFCIAFVLLLHPNVLHAGVTTEHLYITLTIDLLIARHSQLTLWLATSAAGAAAGGNAFNASNYNSTNILALLQSGLAYVSVWTSQSGNQSELRGQIVPYGKVVGASPTISK